MQQYSKPIKRLIREYASRAYEAELGQELGKLEQHFVTWRSGQISADELSELIHEYHQGPARQIWARYRYSRDEDLLVAAAIVDGLLPRDTIPAELLEALHSWISRFERSRAMSDPAEDEQLDQTARGESKYSFASSDRA